MQGNILVSRPKEKPEQRNLIEDRGNGGAEESSATWER